MDHEHTVGDGYIRSVVFDSTRGYESLAQDEAGTGDLAFVHLECAAQMTAAYSILSRKVPMIIRNARKKYV